MRSVVFEMRDAEIPKPWSQLATDIMVSKYFRKAGVSQKDESGNLLRDKEGKSRYKLVRVRRNPDFRSHLLRCRVCKEPLSPTQFLAKARK